MSHYSNIYRTSPVERSAGVRHLSEYTSNLQETFENTPV